MERGGGDDIHPPPRKVLGIHEERAKCEAGRSRAGFDQYIDIVIRVRVATRHRAENTDGTHAVSGGKGAKRLAMGFDDGTQLHARPSCLLGEVVPRGSTVPGRRKSSSKKRRMGRTAAASSGVEAESCLLPGVRPPGAVEDVQTGCRQRLFIPRHIVTENVRGAAPR